MPDYRLSDLLDMNLVQTLADSNFRATGIPMSIIDALDTSILVRAGWTDICMKFHRANQASMQRCLESDASVKDHLVEGEAHQYKCKNGLWHVAIPIMVAGRHLATMFMTQFYFAGEVPEREFFIQQGREFGYDLEGYLAALDRLPIFSREKIDYIIAYDQALVRFISGLAEQSLQLKEAQAELEDRVDARTAELSKAKAFMDNIFDNSADAIGLTDHRGYFTRWNKAGELMYGYTEKGLEGKLAYDLYANGADLEAMLTQLRRDGFVKHYEIDMKKIDGSIFPCSLSIKALRNDHGQIIGSVTVARDLTETRKMLANLEKANVKLQALVAETDERNRQMRLIKEMNDLFQICQNAEETYAAITHFGPKFFPGYTGALYLLNNSENLFEMESSWGGDDALKLAFDHDECWALRRSREQLVDDPPTALNCAHVSASLPAAYLCLPLMAQGKALGILHLQRPAGQPAAPLEGIKEFALAVAEALALALSNLKLRETLRNQAIRDGLTGLFNRRHLEETLNRELSRDHRPGTTTGVIMVDLDHFKDYKDTFGHRAGDELLVALGGFLREQLNREDLLCRFGDKEFLLVMPGAAAEAVLARAEEVIQGVKQLHLQNRSLHPITLSAGVAFYPHHGNSVKELIQVAAAALYQAKAEGCDRVVGADDAHVKQTVRAVP